MPGLRKRCLSAARSCTCKCIRHSNRNLFLDLENVCQLAVERLRPAMVTVARIDQLGVDSHAIARVTNTALEQMIDLQFLRDNRRRFVFAFETERGGQRSNLSPLIPASLLASSSESPSAKYSFSLSGLMLTNGSTASEGPAGRAVAVTTSSALRCAGQKTATNASNASDRYGCGDGATI